MGGALIVLIHTESRSVCLFGPVIAATRTRMALCRLLTSLNPFFGSESEGFPQ